MRWPGFVGGYAQNRSLTVDPELTINWYAEAPDGGTPKISPAFKPTPGLTPFVRLASSPVRALFYQDGRGFAVSGSRFYEIFASQTSIERGTVAVDQNPATISSSGYAGNQLFIVSGGLGYIHTLSTNVFAQITDVAFPPSALMGAFLDSYFLVLHANSVKAYFSAILDGTSWNALEFLAVNQYSDNIVSMTVNNRQLWLQGSQHSQVWLNTGDLNSPFAPIDGGYLESGVEASFGTVQIDNSLMWIALDSRGGRMVMRADGYRPQRISTHAIETYLMALPRVSDAIGWAYQDDGHTFYEIYLPTARHSLVYDVATSQWHQRAVWDPTPCRWYPDLGRCHAYGFEKHLVGDRQSGTIYEMALPKFDSLSGNWSFTDYNFILAAGL